MRPSDSALLDFRGIFLKRSYLWKYVTVFVILVLVVLNLDARTFGSRIYKGIQDDVYPLVTPEPDNSQCRRVFRLAEARAFWEAAAASPAACLASALKPDGVSTCLQRMAERRRRPARLVLIGDSRTRVLFEHMQKHMQLRYEGRLLEEAFVGMKNATLMVRGRPERCVQPIMMFRGTPREKWVCDLSASSHTLHVSFFWCPYVRSDYAQRLATLESACRTGQDCPDLVVFSVGMWYAFPSPPRPFQEQLLSFRQELQQLVPQLQRLTQLTTVVYRPDGQQYTEASGGRKAKLNPVIETINAAAFAQLNKVAGVQLWTSSLAETLHFYHTACMQLTLLNANHTGVQGKLRNECGDKNHIGPYVRALSVGTLLAFMCRNDAQFKPGHCCAAA